MMICPHCHEATRQNKVRATKAGSQRYRCMHCHRKYTPELKKQGYLESVRKRTLEMHMDGGNLRRIARHLNIAPQLVAYWVTERTVICEPSGCFWGSVCAHEHGFEVGNDLAVSGFDGIRDSDHTEPALATLAIPVAQVAQQLVQMLLKITNDQPLDEAEIIIKSELRIRASVDE